MCLREQERRVASHDIGLRPVRFSAVRRQDRVPALDIVQRLQDWVVCLREPVAPHPLDLANPHRDARELGCVGVDLDALDVGWADLWERALEAERFRLELHPVLQVLQRLESEIQEVPRATGRVKHRERAQPVEERPVLPLGLIPPFRAGGG